MRIRCLVSLICPFAFVAVAPFAAADGISNDPIVAIQSVQSCSVFGLDTGPGAVRNGVHCQPGGGAFSLAGILDATLPLYVGGSHTPSWNVVNDTGAPLTSLTLFYSGELASNAALNAQNKGGSPFNMCQIVELGNGRVTAGCSNNTPTPVALPAQITWFTTGAGVPVGGTFNIGTSSFAHAGLDAGCFSGNDECLPNEIGPPVEFIPEPSTLPLLGSGLLGMGAMLRRRFYKFPYLR